MAKSTDSGQGYKKVSDTINAVVAKVDRLYDVARPEAVFAAPITAEGRTVIAAAEVLVGAGSGGGGAIGLGQPPADGSAPGPDAEGMAAGGGGFAHSRPVALIIIDRDGVRVEPIVDATKLGLAAITVLGSLIFLAGRIVRTSRRLG